MVKIQNLILAACFVVAAMFSGVAEARPAYNKAYIAKHGKNEKKCGVCHPEKSKKVRNDYGKAMGKALGGKNIKDADAIKKALDAKVRCSKYAK